MIPAIRTEDFLESLRIFSSAWIRKSVIALHCLSVLVYPSWQSPVHAQAQDAIVGDVIRQAVQFVYQPGYADFSKSSEQFSYSVQSHCDTPSKLTLTDLRNRFMQLVSAFSGVELYRSGPLLEDNRQNRLFYWPDKRRVGERQLRALLNDETGIVLNEQMLRDKSVALQGLPAVERLLFSELYSKNLIGENRVHYCTVLGAIALNINTMASELSTGWSTDSDFVNSLYNPAEDSDYFRTEQEVLRSMVTQIIVGIDVVLNRKLVPLKGDDANWKKAPLWRSAQTIPMIKGNMNSLRALIVDSGLARMAGLESELAFEFRTANTMLQKLDDLPTLLDDTGGLNQQAQSLIRSVAAVTGGIAFTLNDRFVQSLHISAGFNSEDGD